jgi:methylenetetrahydrofolate dehydrogenase (NADP+)/methenyltetrahydrofolate cyclohydrolase
MPTIDGSEIAKQLLTKLSTEVRRLPFTPLFCDVLVGDNAVASSFVKIKAKRAEEIGLKFELIQFPETANTEEVIEKIKTIQRNPFLSGLIVQLPLPAQLDKDAIINAIDPRVDVDALGKNATMASPTASAVIAVLDSLNLDLSTKKILMIGQGELVGKPVTAILRSKGLDVVTADESTANLKELTLTADVIISATGHAKLITGDMIKTDSVLIDCGTSESAGSIVGDVDMDSVLSKAKFISPVPGGVGPVTVAKLLQNVVNVAKDLE